MLAAGFHRTTFDQPEADNVALRSIPSARLHVSVSEVVREACRLYIERFAQARAAEEQAHLDLENKIAAALLMDIQTTKKVEFTEAEKDFVRAQYRAEGREHELGPDIEHAATVRAEAIIELSQMIKSQQDAEAYGAPAPQSDDASQSSGTSPTVKVHPQ